MSRGHWGAEYAVFNAENLNADGVASLTLTQAILDAAYTQQYWGGTFILNGDGNVTLTKVTLKPATADGIRNAKLSTNVLDKDALMYNLAGQRVSSSYKGVVIQNGNPFLIYILHVQSSLKTIISLTFNAKGISNVNERIDFQELKCRRLSAFIQTETNSNLTKTGTAQLWMREGMRK